MFDWVIRFLANYWSRTQEGSRLNILTYHRVNEFYDIKNPKTIDLVMFKQQIKWLKKHFIILPLPEALELQDSNALPPRAVCLTVDDGYRDSYELIYKTLQYEGVSATFFISTKGLNSGGLWDAEIYSAIFNAPIEVKSVTCGGNYFNLSCLEERILSRYQLTELTKYLSLCEREKVINELKEQTHFGTLEEYFLSAEQIKQMHSSGMTIGAHTHNHPILMKENCDVALFEMKQSKELLEQIIEEPVEYFAYPNGKFGQDYNESHMVMAESLGFKAALSTDWGSLTDLANDRFRIKRFTPWDEKEAYFALRLALNYRK